MTNCGDQPERSHKATRIASWVREAATLWGVLASVDGVSVTFSSRFSRSFGNCRVREGRIRLADWLLSQPESQLREALVHELAHWAAVLKYGDGIRPHGPEWKSLMILAGYEPRARIPRPGQSSRRSSARSAIRYLHSCLVCHAEWTARRAVAEWRCPECLEAGLPGTLQIRTEANTHRRGP